MNREELKDLKKGDEVLVDVGLYVRTPNSEGPIERWCRVVSHSKGTASVYPIKVSVPTAGLGQFGYDEVIDYRRNGGNRRVVVFLDSGANTHSTATRHVSLDDLGVSSIEEWNNMGGYEQLDVLSHIFPGFCWGVKPLED